MSRSGYSYDDDDNWSTICWRGAVASAIRGKRGQAFLKEMKAALEALPEKKLIKNDLQDEYEDGAVCALGAVGRLRDLKMDEIEPEDREQVASSFGIPYSLACEIMYLNDEQWPRLSPEARYEKVLEWIEGFLK